MQFCHFWIKISNKLMCFSKPKYFCSVKQNASTFSPPDHRDVEVFRPSPREKRQRVVRTPPISRQSFHFAVRAEKAFGTFAKRRRPKCRRKRPTRLSLQESGDRVHQLHGQGNWPTHLSTVFRRSTKNGRRSGGAEHSSMDRTCARVRILMSTSTDAYFNGHT